MRIDKTAPHAQTPTPAQHIDAGTKPVLCALIACVLGGLVTFGVCRTLISQWHDAAQSRFEGRCERATTRLRRTVDATGTLLRGERAILQRDPGMLPDDWRRYVNALDLANSPLPVRALGYASMHAPGTQNANTQSDVDAPASVTLFTPAADNRVDDLVAHNDATRHALQRAADSGQLALAARPDPDIDTQSAVSGILMLYLPVYSVDPQHLSANDRRRALTGFLFASIDTRRLFDPLVAGTPAISLDVSSGNPARRLYATESLIEELPAETSLNMKRTVNVAGTSLSLVFTGNGSPGATGANDALTTVLAAGTVGTLALAAACALAAMGWNRRSRPDNSRTLDDERMMAIIRSSMEAIITVDETQRVVIFNPMAERVFGVSAMDAIGAPLERFIPERFRGAHARHVEQFGVTGVSDRQMGQQRVLYGLRANGEEFPIEASISQIRDARGKLYTVMLRDVTERVRADNALRLSREELRELSANLQAVREEEKTRIARELHDDLGQQLTALKMDVSVVEEAVRGAGDASAADSSARGTIVTQLGSVRRLIDATVASVRRIAADLRPVMLDDLGLVPAIEWLANDFTNRYGIEVERRIAPGNVTFTSTGATTLFRIVQEALTNVARHAEATHVVLTLVVDGEHCMLSIADNGQGTPDISTARAGRADKSFGLIGIRERAYLLGGTVEIESSPARGFTITVTAPLRAVQQEEMLS